VRTVAIAGREPAPGFALLVTNLAVTIARRSRRVHLVDLDPAGPCGPALGVGGDAGDGPGRGLIDRLLESDGTIDAFDDPGHPVRPDCSLRGVTAESLASLEARPGGPARLRDALLAAADGRPGGDHVCLIHLPSTMGPPAWSAIEAADEILLPSFDDERSVRTADALRASILRAGPLDAAPPRVRSIVVRRDSTPAEASSKARGLARERFGPDLIPMMIDRWADLERHARDGRAIVEVEPTSLGALVLDALTESLGLDRMASVEPPPRGVLPTDPDQAAALAREVRSLAFRAAGGDAPPAASDIDVRQRQRTRVHSQG